MAAGRHNPRVTEKAPRAESVPTAHSSADGADETSQEISSKTSLNGSEGVRPPAFVDPARPRTHNEGRKDSRNPQISGGHDMTSGKTSNRKSRQPKPAAGGGLRAGARGAQAGGQIGSVGGTAAAGPQKTVATMLGEMVWLLSMSPTHRHFALSDLEWLIMPPLMLQQFRIYYDGQTPMALALWAYLSEDSEQKLESGSTRLRPDEWRADGTEVLELLKKRGQGSLGTPLPEDMREPKGTLWLVDLIAPLATPQNKLAEKVLSDLATTVFKGKKFKFHVTDPQTGKREVKELG